jgi:hypothetical protein
MRWIILVAALAAFVGLAVAATIDTGRSDGSPSHAAPPHARAFWVAHHRQP